jgi:hypothetical protein
MNFLYLLGPLNLSPWQNNEIRYSIRSIDVAFHPDWIGITGPEMPSFLTGIEHFKVDIKPDFSRYKNVQRQLILACEAESTPENLILMNDDFIVRSHPKWDWTPTFTRPIGKPVADGRYNPWKRTVFDTGEWLRAKGIVDPLCYEGHTPMPFKKSLALPILRELLSSEKPLQFRSAYGNVVGIGGQLHPNAKRADPDKWPVNSPFWSLKGHVTDKAKKFLETWLNKPSRWEA